MDGCKLVSIASIRVYFNLIDEINDSIPCMLFVVLQLIKFIILIV